MVAEDAFQQGGARARHADGRPDPDTLHAGVPVERGEKWLATLWLRQRRYRDF
jgi:hypothetical protein